ncbi:MAG TPA: polyprenyl synthetase family protein [Saprospiraceae bacterium]|nr:polyprenyl synthetase family protein [Saprospiraceae bacterium]
MSANVSSFGELLGVYENFYRQNVKHLQPTSLYEPVRYMMDLPGKKIRPLAVLYCGNLCGANHQDTLKAALGLEYFHNFTLIHDDIMDEAATRRGHTAVHIKYGVPSSILAGDVMMIEATKWISEAGKHSDILDLFLTTSREICEGQAMDMDYSRITPSTNEYLEMIKLKTAVLLACAFQIACTLGNQSTVMCKLFYQLGIETGLCFQIKDDWLDLYGDTDLTGKRRGGDILAGKKNILFLEALAAADSKDKLRLEFLFSANCAADLRFAEATEIYSKYNIKDRVANVESRYSDRIWKLIDEIGSIDPVCSEGIKPFIQLIIERSF